MNGRRRKVVVGRTITETNYSLLVIIIGLVNVTCTCTHTSVSICLWLLFPNYKITRQLTHSHVTNTAVTQSEQSEHHNKFNTTIPLSYISREQELLPKYSFPEQTTIQYYWPQQQAFKYKHNNKSHTILPNPVSTLGWGGPYKLGLFGWVSSIGRSKSIKFL